MNLSFFLSFFVVNKIDTDISKYRVKYTNLKKLTSNECLLESSNLLNETELCLSSHFETDHANQTANVSSCPELLVRL